jgi:DNA-binding transcriptional regulator/RsmH inhibitor MraZ
VVPTREDVDDGHEVFGKLLFCGTYVVILDHECRVVLSTNPFKELKGESTEPVLVGNHNFFDISSHDVFHHP